MRVILRENIENLGKKGDIVNVARGFGRNYLIPKNKAIEVTSRNKKKIEIEQKALQKGFEKEKASYQDLIVRLNTSTLSFTRKTSEKDVIFGSVSSTDIRDALMEQGFDVEKKKILLDEPIKRLGNYTVPIKIFHEERAEVKLEVIKEGEPAVKEEMELGPEPIKEEATASEPVQKMEGSPVVEQKKEAVTLTAAKESQDVLEEAKEKPDSEPVFAEEIAKEEEKPESMLEPEVIESETAAADEPPSEETKKRPLETLEEPLDEQETEPGESLEESGIIPDEAGEIPEDSKESPEDVPEVPEETKESVEDTNSVFPESERKTEEDDSQEAKNKDNK